MAIFNSFLYVHQRVSVPDIAWLSVATPSGVSAPVLGSDFSSHSQQNSQDHWYMVSENREHPEKPNGFADHYPYEKWLFHWEYTQHFQTNPYMWGVFRRDQSVWCFEQSKPSLSWPQKKKHLSLRKFKAFPQVNILQHPSTDNSPLGETVLSVAD